MNDKRMCYVIIPHQREEEGYIPSLVIENESGHSPMIGKDNLSTPWYWGKTIAEAEAICAKVNLEKFGLTPEETLKIVLSSMKK